MIVPLFPAVTSGYNLGQIHRLCMCQTSRLVTSFPGPLCSGTTLKLQLVFLSLLCCVLLNMGRELCIQSAYRAAPRVSLLTFTGLTALTRMDNGTFPQLLRGGELSGRLYVTL